MKQLINEISNVLRQITEDRKLLFEYNENLADYSSEEYFEFRSFCHDLFIKVINHIDLLNTIRKNELEAIRNDINQLSGLLIDTKNPNIPNQIYSSLHNVLNRLKTQGIFGVLTQPYEINDELEKIKIAKLQSDELFEASVKTKEAINNLLPMATASTLSSKIHDRILVLEESVKKWKQASIGCSIGISLLALIIMICFNKSNLSVSDWVQRFFIISPIIYLLVFCYRRYAKERKILEIYEHKKIVAQSLPAYMDHATEEKKDDILMSGTAIIYSLPENPETAVNDNVDLKTLIDLLTKLNKLK